LEKEGVIEKNPIIFPRKRMKEEHEAFLRKFCKIFLKPPTGRHIQACAIIF
jgi:hypothetical protein